MKFWQEDGGKVGGKAKNGAYGALVELNRNILINRHLIKRRQQLRVKWDEVICYFGIDEECTYGKRLVGCFQIEQSSFSLVGIVREPGRDKYCKGIGILSSW
jgi:hypothetical protein